MAEATATMRQEWVDRRYSQEQLKDKGWNFLRSCRYAVFRQLVRSGEIDQHLETKANECRQHAESVVDQGTFYERRGRGPRGCISRQRHVLGGRANDSRAPSPLNQPAK